MSQLTQPFFEKLLSAEGGYQNQPADKGNYNRCGANAGTKYGITPNAWQDYSGQRCPGPDTMKSLTQTQAWDFIEWWGNRWRIWEIYDQEIAELVFNAFYGNPSVAAKSLQLTLNQRGYALASDGILGSKTLAAVNVEAARDKTGLYNTYREAWVAYLQSLGNAQYQTGWQNRMDRYFPPLPVREVAALPSSGANYQTELWQRRFSGVWKNTEDTVWVGSALTVLFAVLAILYFRIKTLTL